MQQLPSTAVELFVGADLHTHDGQLCAHGHTFDKSIEMLISLSELLWQSLAHDVQGPLGGLHASAVWRALSGSISVRQCLPTATGSGPGAG